MRSYEESCVYLDRIIGHCVRDAAFAEAVLRDPESALAEYELNENEMDDFRALQNRHREEAWEGWSALRASLAQVSKSPAQQP
jgi:hypothetical protein